MADVKAPNKERIFQQITKAADTYAPKVYALLNGMGDFTAEQEMQEQFVPLTAVKTNGGIPFIVGLLPPTSNVTGRLLDRSASVRDTTQSAEGGTETNAPKTGSVPGGSASDVGKPGLNDRKMVSFTPTQLRTALRNAFIKKYGKPPTEDQLALLFAQVCVENGSSPHAKEMHAYNYNLGSIHSRDGGATNAKPPNTTPPIPAPSDKVPRPPSKSNGAILGYSDAPASYYLGTDFIYVQPTADNPADPNGLGAKQYQYVYFEAYPSLEAAAEDQVNLLARLNAPTKSTPEDFAKALAPNAKDDDPGKGAYYGVKVSAYAAGLRMHYNAYKKVFAGVADDDSASSSASWQGTGSDNAKTADNESAKLANGDLNRTELGRKFLAAQLASITATVKEIEKIKNTPPLRLLVNPQSFKVSSDKIVSDSNWTRNGPIIEHWGDGQDKIEASGKVAGFYSIDVNNAATPGLSRTAKHYSAAYQNLLSLYLLYKNNGSLFLNLAQITGNTNEINRLSVVGSIYLYYDGILYFGSFDNFNITESDSSPFTLEYNFQFTVRSAFLLDTPPMPGMTYGNTKIITGDPSLKSTKEGLEDQILGGGPVALPSGSAAQQSYAATGGFLEGELTPEQKAAADHETNKALLGDAFAEATGVGTGKDLLKGTSDSGAGGSPVKPP